jgi:hypothetical protein
MRVTHYARQSLVAAVLALALAACSKDSSGPSEFNPQGTTADMTAAESAFSSQQMSSFAVLGADISATLGGSAAVKSSAMAVGGATGAATRYARELAALVPQGGASPASMASIPSQYLGTTFVWDVATDTYVASDLPGAPSAGVRFLLYAVDPVLLQPVEPLVEVGYVDITDHSTATTVDVNVKVVEGGTVYLDYDVTSHATTSGGVVVISGFASDGTTIANFQLNNTLTTNGSSQTVAFDYHIDVPSRHLSLDWTATITITSNTDWAIALDFTISGPNGSVRLTGDYEGTLTVRVNGDLFATIDLSGTSPVITGADGQPLTADEQTTLQTILEFYAGSAQVFGGLLEPVAVS